LLGPRPHSLTSEPGTAPVKPENPGDLEVGLPDQAAATSAFLSFDRILALGTLGILLIRGIFIVPIALDSLGLAIALAGLLFTWAVRQDTWPPRSSPSSSQPLPSPRSGFLLPIAETTGALAIFLGWLATVSSLPSGAVLVSGVAILFWQPRASVQK
jgi:hypothetical protein